MVQMLSITTDLVGASSFSVGLIEDYWTGLFLSVALKDDFVPLAGVQDSLIRKNWQATVILHLVIPLFR